MRQPESRSAPQSPALEDRALYRLGLAGAGSVLLYLASNYANIISPARVIYYVPLLIGLGAIGFILLLASGIRRPPEFARWLILAAYILQVITQSVLWLDRTKFGEPNLVDSGSYTELAGQLMLNGRNPYAWDYGGVFDIRRAAQVNSTPLLNGASESPFPYPALSILLVLPFRALGLYGVFTISILAHVILLTLTFTCAPRRWQPVILLPALAGFDFGFLTVIGNMDILWVTALVGMVAAWRNPVWRAICYGLAVSLKQNPVLLAPFLLIRIWRGDSATRSLPELLRFILIGIGTFALINGPFIIWDPAAWFNGYTEPVRDSMVLISHGGLSTITQTGNVFLPKGFFIAAALLVFGLLVFTYWRHYHQLRDAYWIMPGIAMWFSYRALISYWLYWALPMILAILRPSDSPPLPLRHPSWRPTVVLASGALLGLILAAAILGRPTSPIQLKLLLPMFAREGEINRLRLELTNGADRELTPRFSIQSRRTTTNPLPWYIEAGPVVLMPGESAIYTITTDRADRSFNGPESVQVVVTDANGDYSLRGVISIEPDVSYLWPELLTNANYRMWDVAADVPFAWFKSPAGKVAYAFHQGREAISLTAGPGGHGISQVQLSNLVLFPEGEFGIWLNPPGSNGSTAYGVSIQEGQHRLWLLYGPERYTGVVPDGYQVLQHRIPSGEWSYQEIDLQSIYSQLEWPMPDPGRLLYRSVEMEARVLQLSLLLAAEDVPESTAYFGPILQDDARVAPRTWMADSLDDPAGYYLRLAEAYEADHNYARALEAYQQALGYAPHSTEIISNIERLRERVADMEQ